MKTRAIIFDLDGTLLDTVEDLADAANQVLSRGGFPIHPVEKYNHFVGDGLKTLIKRILPPDRVDEQTVRECMESFGEIYITMWNNKSRPYGGITEMLKSLKEQGVELAVLSNKPHDFTTMCVQESFSKDLFSHVFGQREGIPKKPDPAGALEIARLLGLNPAEIVYVGDTSVDMTTGRDAGMFTLGVLWGFRDREELEQSGAGKIIEHPQEIVDHVLTNC
ncbi:MAG: HAD family hydrolase [Thermodesulfobacteriota bacterium]